MTMTAPLSFPWLADGMAGSGVERPVAAPASTGALANARSQFAAAADVLDLDRGIRAILGSPRRELGVSLPVRLADDSVDVVAGFRVQHSVARGPAKGGVRVTRDVTLDDVRALAMWMTWKCALFELPFGGGKGAIAVDPKGLAAGEHERVVRRYARAIEPIIGPDIDIPAPDLGSGEAEMGWILDAYSGMRAGWDVVTGKPLALGGSAGRAAATSVGVAAISRLALRRAGITPGDASAAVQGFGKVGRRAALELANAGSRIVAVADAFGAVVAEKGLDVRALALHVDRTGTVVGFEGGDEIRPTSILTLPVDLLVPAAVEGVITSANAGQVQARVVVEGANGPVTAAAEAILLARGISIVPDILANGGGVVASYFEWVQGRQGWWWSEQNVLMRLVDSMEAAWRVVTDRAARDGIDLRIAATAIAVERVALATASRGFEA